MSTSSKSKPSHSVYIVDGDGEAAFWTRVGAVWPHEDGDGFSIVLTAIPLTGRLVVRKPKPQAET
jgi:hypothetical protein